MPELIEAYRPIVEAEIRRVLVGRDLLLYRMIAYHLGWVDASGSPTKAKSGKYLRATLCLMTSEALSGETDVALPAAAAIELVHNFSLVHDDIQDQDKERRGRPTVWSIWGAPQAINVGSAMRMLASMCVDRLVEKGLSPEKTIFAHEVLDEATLAMIEGQFLDISYEERLDVSTMDYIAMIEKKTSALIQAALLLGAIPHLERGLLEPFRRFGRHLGISFQIRDDYLGIWGSADVTGKPLGSDIRRRKKSYPVVLALELASGDDARVLREIYRKDLLTEEDVKRVLDILEALGAREKTTEMANSHYELSLKEIAALPISEDWAQKFREVARFLSSRDF